MTILAIGAGVALSGVRPVPVIVAAQALNGAILPMVAILLLVLGNDRKLLGPEGVNSRGFNALTVLVIGLCLLLGWNQWHALMTS
ncbi:MAG: divalent metal cation transporter, partial [Acidobacteriota bacterium]|nr:divalent metal cation transporter [Acidobacteriota bacterium]